MSRDYTVSLSWGLQFNTYMHGGEDDAMEGLNLTIPRHYGWLVVSIKESLIVINAEDDIGSTVSIEVLPREKQDLWQSRLNQFCERLGRDPREDALQGQWILTTGW